jgi:DNA processing protein
VIAREIETVARLGARHVLLGEPDYPALLAELKPEVTGRRCAARSCASPRAKRHDAAEALRAPTSAARGLAQDLAAQRLPVTSGLARGIDTAAHIGAPSLSAGGAVSSSASSAG